MIEVDNIPDEWKAPPACSSYRVRDKNVFTGPREVRGLHRFRIHCVLEFHHPGKPHTDPTGRTWE